MDTVYLLYDLRVAQLDNRNDFPLFFMSKGYSLFLVHPPPQMKTLVCDKAQQCVLLLVSILLARVQTMSMCPKYHTLEAGDVATRNAV